MQYAIEIGSNCNFHDSQGSAEHKHDKGVMGNVHDMCTQYFLRNLTIKEFCK